MTKFNSMESNNSTLMTILSVFLYLLTVITWQSVAAIFTIMAAASTLCLNLYKVYTDMKDRKRKQIENENSIK